MTKKLRRALVAAGLGVAVLIPAGTALAVGDNPAPDPDRVCTGDHDMDRIRARDGTGWRHTTSDGTVVEVQPGAGFRHQGGPMDGTRQGERPADGTGYQWRGGPAS